MNPKSLPTFIFLSLSLLFYPTTNAFNITKMLSQNSDFSSLNNFLTQTQLADQINSRQTITLLAVDNSGISELSSYPTDTIKKILGLHVILDYYDAQKLQKLSNKTALLTTLFQSSGEANGQLGFLNVTDTSKGVSFGSAIPGSSLGANLVKSVVSQPYNISVLQISSIIIPTGITSKSNSSSSKSPASSPTASPSKAPSKAPTPSAAAAPKSDKSPTATPSESPSADTPSPTATPSESPSADTPSPTADTPVADTPTGDSPTAADGPSADSPSGTADSPPGDSSGALGVGSGIHGFAVLMMVLCFSWSLDHLV